MIKVYKPMFIKRDTVCVKAKGKLAKLWAGLTVALESVFEAECKAHGRAVAEDMLMTCVDIARGRIDPAAKEAAE